MDWHEPWNLLRSYRFLAAIERELCFPIQMFYIRALRVPATSALTTMSYWGITQFLGAHSAEVTPTAGVPTKG